MKPKQPGGFAPKADATKFTGVVGRQSSKKSGKQGMHHHQQMADLGNAVAKGMKPGSAVMPPKGGGYC